MKKRTSKTSLDSARSLPGKVVDVSIVEDASHLLVEQQNFAEISSMFSYPVGNRDVCDQNTQELLAHYLDIVFPAQFPLSTHAKVARTWLLPLLLRVPPLYHAAISLAAFHKNLPHATADRNVSIHHGLALGELRQYLTKIHDDLAASLAFNVDVLASIVLLVSLEVSVCI